MRVAYYITNFPYAERGTSSIEGYACGGAEWAAYHLALEMARRGHEVEVYAASMDGRDSVGHYEGVTVRRYGTNLAVESARVSLRMLRDFRKDAVDIVHAHYTVPTAAYAAWYHARRRKTPFILTYHSEQRSGYGAPLRRLGAMIDNLIVRYGLLPSARIIIAPSPYYVEESAFLRRQKEKVVSIPNGVNPADFDVPVSREECRDRLGLPRNTRVVLFMGALSPQKAPDVLVKAVPAVAESVPDFTLVMAGMGIMRQQLEQLAKDLNVSRSVRFAGQVDYSSRHLYYKAADVFVLPSIEETFGIVLLEASASGLPMVVTDLPTFKWIIRDGFNGLVVPRGSESGLARALLRLLRDDQLRSTMGQNAKGQVSSYSWTAIAEETERLYFKVLEAA